MKDWQHSETLEAANWRADFSGETIRIAEQDGSTIAILTHFNLKGRRHANEVEVFAKCLAESPRLLRENTILREALEQFRGQFDCHECTGTAEDALDLVRIITKADEP